jgi:DNA-binding IclR family transcriptional regulator
MSTPISAAATPYKKRAVASSFIKGLELLTLLARSPSGLSMSALRQRSRQPRTSILRMLSTLEFFGLTARNGALWCTTPRFHDWCNRDMHGELRKRYHAALDRIATEVDELVELGVAEGDGIRFIDYVQSKHNVVIEPLKTSLYPLHQSASGKLFLTQRPDLCEEIRDARLLAEIAAARTSGMAWNRGETDPNVIAIATWAGPPSALTPMIAVIWPFFRFSESKARRAVSVVRQVLAREGNLALRDVRPAEKPTR